MLKRKKKVVILALIGDAHGEQCKKLTCISLLIGLKYIFNIFTIVDMDYYNWCIIKIELIVDQGEMMLI